MHSSGLMRVRSFAPIGRRRFLEGAAALGGLAAAGLPARRATAATEITMLCWQSYDEPLTTDDFLEKNGINLNATYIGNNDEIVTKLQAGGVGSIDLVTPYMGYVPLLALAGLIDPIDESLVPNLQDCEPVFRDDSNAIVDGVRYGVPFTWGAAPMMYDPAVVTGVPESWADLWKPEYTGRVGMADDPLGNMMLAALLATDAEGATMLTMDQLEQTEEYLIKLKPQLRMIAVSWGELADALSRGDVIITFSGWEQIKKFCADKGKVIEYTYPKEGTYAWLDTYCVGRNAPNREVAHRLCNKVIDVSAQIKLGDELIQGIVNKKAIAQLGPSKEIYPYHDLASFGRKARFFAFPPHDSDGTHATWNDWQEAYQRFKTA